MKKKRENREVMDALILVLQIGITMLVPILLCTVGGAWLDHHFRVNLLGLIGFVLGAAAGFQNVYRLVKKYIRNIKSPGEQKREQERKAKEME